MRRVGDEWGSLEGCGRRWDRHAPEDRDRRRRIGPLYSLQGFDDVLRRKSAEALGVRKELARRGSEGESGGRCVDGGRG